MRGGSVHEGTAGDSAVIDAVLETSVVGSFTKVGYEVRRRLFDWNPSSTFDMAGKVAIITGGNSGLGLVTAKTLVRSVRPCASSPAIATRATKPPRSRRWRQRRRAVRRRPVAR